MGRCLRGGSVPDTQRIVDETSSHFPAIHILVNCVGLNREQKAEEATEKVFDLVFDVNVKSAMFQAQAVAKHMIRQGTGGKQFTSARCVHYSDYAAAVMQRTAGRRRAHYSLRTTVGRMVASQN